ARTRASERRSGRRSSAAPEPPQQAPIFVRNEVWKQAIRRVPRPASPSNLGKTAIRRAKAGEIGEATPFPLSDHDFSACRPRRPPDPRPAASVASAQQRARVTKAFPTSPCQGFL